MQKRRLRFFDVEICIFLQTGENGSPPPSEEGIGLDSLPFKMALPMVAVGTFILALSFAFCCYLAR